MADVDLKEVAKEEQEFQEQVELKVSLMLTEIENRVAYLSEKGIEVGSKELYGIINYSTKPLVSYIYEQAAEMLNLEPEIH